VICPHMSTVIIPVEAGYTKRNEDGEYDARPVYVECVREACRLWDGRGRGACGARRTVSGGKKDT
jgi:hypothetical protein